MWNGASAAAVLGHPLVSACRTLRQFPLKAEQIFEVVVAPLRRRGGPGNLQSAGDRVTAFASAKAITPAKALGLDASSLRLFRDVLCRRRAVGLAKAVTASDERDRFVVIHGHATESFANINRCGKRIGFAVRALRVDIDQAHLHSGQGVLKVARVRYFAIVILHKYAVVFLNARRSSRVAGVAAEPLGFTTPVHILVRLPHVKPTSGKAESFKAHAFQSHVSG